MFYEEFEELRSNVNLTFYGESEELNNEDINDIRRFLWEIDYLNANLCNYFEIKDILGNKQLNKLPYTNSMDELMYNFSFNNFRALIKDKNEDKTLDYFIKKLKEKNLLADEVKELEIAISEFRKNFIESNQSLLFVHRKDDTWKKKYNSSYTKEEKHNVSLTRVIQSIDNYKYLEIINTFKDLIIVIYKLFYIYTRTPLKESPDFLPVKNKTLT